MRLVRKQIGRLAARRLLEEFEHGRQGPVRSYVENELLIRSSCGCPVAVATKLPAMEVAYVENTAQRNWYSRA